MKIVCVALCVLVVLSACDASPRAKRNIFKSVSSKISNVIKGDSDDESTTATVDVATTVSTESSDNIFSKLSDYSSDAIANFMESVKSESDDSEDDESLWDRLKSKIENSVSNLEKAISENTSKSPSVVIFDYFVTNSLMKKLPDSTKEKIVQNAILCSMTQSSDLANSLVPSMVKSDLSNWVSNVQNFQTSVAKCTMKSVASNMLTSLVG